MPPIPAPTTEAPNSVKSEPQDDTNTSINSVPPKPAVKSEPKDDANVTTNSIPQIPALTGLKALEIIGLHFSVHHRTFVSMKSMAPGSREHFKAQCEMALAKYARHNWKAKRRQERADEEQRRINKEQRKIDAERQIGRDYLMDAYRFAFKSIESPSVSPAEFRAANRAAETRRSKELLEKVMGEAPMRKEIAEWAKQEENGTSDTARGTGTKLLMGTTVSASTTQHNTVEDGNVMRGTAEEGGNKRKRVEMEDSSEAIGDRATKK